MARKKNPDRRSQRLEELDNSWARVHDAAEAAETLALLLDQADAIVRLIATTSRDRAILTDLARLRILLRNPEIVTVRRVLNQLLEQIKATRWEI